MFFLFAVTGRKLFILKVGFTLWFILLITQNRVFDLYPLDGDAKMATQFFFVFLCLMMFIGDIVSTSDICKGAHCQRSSRSPDHKSASPHHQSRFSVYSPRRPAVPYTVIQPQQSRTGSPKENPRTITAEVFNPHGCTGGRCHGSARPTHNNTKECKGLECKLPVRIQQEPRQHPCIGDACSRGSHAGRGRLSFAHMQDRAEQVLEEFPEFGLRGGPSSGIQLTCDIKPGKHDSFCSVCYFISDLTIGNSDITLAIMQSGTCETDYMLVSCLLPQRDFNL